MTRNAARRVLSAALISLVLAGCGLHRQPEVQPAPPPLAPTAATATAGAPMTGSGLPNVAELAKSAAFLDTLYATLWFQSAEERRGLSLQAYGAARLSLDAALADPQWTAALEQQPGYQQLPPAIVVDIDETVLDNSPSQTRVIRKGVRWNRADWNAWCQEARAEAVPGAVEFLQAADKRGVTVFYISNRAAELEDATRRNLLLRGFPVEPGTLILKQPGSHSDKGPRRRAIADRYRIVLLAGDDLGDFMSEAYTSPADREKAGALYAARWGRQWIVLPNPMYGSWRESMTNWEDLGEEEALRRLDEQLEN